MVASLCQYVALHLDLPQLAAQFDELLSFAGTERTGLHWCCTTGLISLAHPVHDAGAVAAKLLGQLAWLSACSNQFNHLLTKLRRIRLLGVAVVTHLDFFLT